MCKKNVTKVIFCEKKFGVSFFFGNFAAARRNTPYCFYKHTQHVFYLTMYSAATQAYYMLRKPTKYSLKRYANFK